MARLITAGASTPVGAIQEFPGTAAPRGWVEARGDVELSRSVYARLWAFAQASGNLAADEASKQDGQFGPGDGSTTFTTPDYRGLVRRGWDNGRGVDVGRGIGTYQADQNKSHNHGGNTGTGGGHSHSQYGYATNSNASSTTRPGAGWTGFGAGGKWSTGGGGNHSLPIAADGAGEVTMKNAAVLVCIKH